MAHPRHLFIQKAIKCKNCLHSWAAKHGFLNRDGTINLEKAHHYAEVHHLKKELKRIHLAHTLRGFKHPRERSLEHQVMRM